MKIYDSIRVVERTQSAGSAEGRMDAPNYGEDNLIPLPLFVEGHKKNRQIYKCFTVRREMGKPTSDCS